MLPIYLTPLYRCKINRIKDGYELLIQKKFLWFWPVKVERHVKVVHSLEDVGHKYGVDYVIDVRKHAKKMLTEYVEFKEKLGVVKTETRVRLLRVK